MGHKQWRLKDVPDPSAVESLAEDLNNLPASLARSLVLRDIDTLDTARSFFRDGLDQLHDPFLFSDMQKAVERLQTAMEAGEKVVVYGDYDVDGTTSTALLTDCLRGLGISTDYFVPDRFRHGYGLSKAGITEAEKLGASLIVALDCGVTSVDEVAFAAEKGIDVIICDHHTPQDELPKAIAVLDAKRADDTYPFAELCGCGVTFKLAQAFYTHLGKNPDDLLHYLDLVAIATAADMVPLKGENRILLREGIHRLRTRPRLGVRMLADQANTRLSEATTRSIVFSLGPRINAAGRLGDAARAVNLLLAGDQLEATARARQLERLNDERRSLDQETQKQAYTMADRFLAGKERHAVVLHHPDWHLGVIGIVASRLVERHYRPAIMLTTSGKLIKGSARSVAGINVFNALTACSDLLVEYGGHDYAAGLSLEASNLPEFIRRFDKAIAQSATEEALQPTVDVDAEMGLGDLDQRFWSVLKQFRPFGQDNPPPVFIARDLDVIGPVATVGRNRDHLKFSVRARGVQHPVRPVIGFGLGKHVEEVADAQARGETIELAFSIDENVWNGRTTLQLQLEDVRVSG